MSGKLSECQFDNRVNEHVFNLFNTSNEACNGQLGRGDKESKDEENVKASDMKIL